MNCREAHELLLEADPGDLRGEGDSPLAVHLRSCDRCAARAALVLGAQSRLADHLAARRPHTPTPSAIEQAAVTARRRQAHRRLAWRATPVLVAATIAGILVATREPSPAQRTVPERIAQRATPTIATPSDQDVVVYQTDNPNILIVWLY